MDKKTPHIEVVTNATNATVATNVIDETEATQCDILRQKCDIKNSNIVVPEPESTVYNLTREIRNYVENSIGSFTVRDLDNYLGLDRSYAVKRNKVLSRLHKENILIRTGNGIYQRSMVELERISLFGADETEFNIELPLGLSDMLEMPKKAIIVIAGTANAGKTLFALETAKLNLDKDYPVAYFMSEMGKSEFIKRVKGVCEYDIDLLKKWDKKVFSAERTSAYPPAIAKYCADGLGIIDFLNPPNGDYSLVTRSIEEIYDRITTGVVCICMQKGDEVSHAKGGTGTQEKARLFITMDRMKDFRSEHGTFVTIKLEKVKCSRDKDVNMMELHAIASFKNGIIPLSGWHWVSSKADRNREFSVYATESDGERKVRMLEATEVSKYGSSTGFTPDETKVEGLF